MPHEKLAADLSRKLRNNEAELSDTRIGQRAGERHRDLG
jgi:hypothetical protein